MAYEQRAALTNMPSKYRAFHGEIKDTSILLKAVKLKRRQQCFSCLSLTDFELLLLDAFFSKVITECQKMKTRCS